MNNLTTLQVTEEDAKLFLEFQKHYRFIKFLQDVGAFDMKDGHLTVHFTRLGEVGTFDLVEKFNHFKLPLSI